MHESDESVAAVARTRWGLWLTIGLATVFAVGLFLLKQAGQSRFEAGTFVTRAMGSQRPTDLGIAFEAINIPTGERQLAGWWVPAENAKAAVLVWHGQNEALSDWTHAIKRLHDAKLAVLVFDYAGFGDSPGKPSVEVLRQDSMAAVKVFHARSGNLPRYHLGYSMGAGVMLDYLHQHPTASKGVVLVSAWSSIREVALASGQLPKALQWMVPDVYDNGMALAGLDGQVSIVHSRTDGRFPVSMAESNHAKRHDSQLVITPTPMHSDFLSDPKILQGAGEPLWDAVLGFLH
jgi:pimeloyl-ACP methyl ester carboxylesterase